MTVFAGYGIVTSGASTILRVNGAMLMVNGMTNMTLQSEQIRNQLMEEDYGRKFLELWPTISTTVDVATITTFIYVARRSLIKLGRELSPIEQAKIETELTKAEVKFATFTDIEINQYVRAATRNPDANKVMLGKYEVGNGSYIKRAGTEYSYFDMGIAKWQEAETLINSNVNEMWRINKTFIDSQKALGKEFYLSHDPFNSLIVNGYYKMEIDYLTVTLKGRITKVNDNLWKIIW